MAERGDIWLAVAGMVVRDGKVLVVKKSYGATKGLWTLPGGFVNADETLDMAASREVREETGIEATAEAILAVRSGVLRKGKHDTLLVFRLRYAGGTETRCEREIDTIDWLTPDEIAEHPDTTEFLAKIVREVQAKDGLQEHPIEHTRDYGYSVYKMFM
ncbi:NUDIX hydrolase [Tumebacillus sp. DT12]|uniref:NUDIX hydrolase n=1 Tax=Tumebacillus lacus TaxID=2995335 RepID=A0ABT3X474_9BACL|nr:NUDIX hydrolase [Tumebacillus lacus]MCX7571697.1 NUDIX hydrolase [Tumebacillus lacus]